jgi:hypothetical protein
MAPMKSLLLALLLLPQGPVDEKDAPIFNGVDLAGWTVHGDARYTVDEDSILGETTKGGHSFLVTERTFGDFVFELRVKTEKPGNSGIQIRSHINAKGRMVGYQIEIDPSERAWSGGLYDEGRRGWLQNLEGRDEARAAFRHGEWNHYRIECRGPWIRTWVNGVPVTDHLDPLDVEGVIGLQVHSGKNTRVRWSALELVDLGKRTWKNEEPPPSADLTARWVHDPERPATLTFPTAPGSPFLPRPSEPIAPGIAVGDGFWTVDLRRGLNGLEDGEPHRIAVCAVNGRVSVFVDGKRVADARTKITGTGLPVIKDAPGAEFLGLPVRR